MPSYNSAARNYDTYPEYDDEYEQPTQTRRTAPTQGLPAYRVAGTGGQITRQQPTLPQPLPGAMPRRQPTGANVPALAPRTYGQQDYARRAMQPTAPIRRRQSQGNVLSRVGFQPGAGSMKMGIMAVGIVGILVVSYLVVSFGIHTWQVWQDDMTYGRPRITRLQATVGHNELGGNKTLFVAQNLNGQISITEFPGGDATKTRVIVGPHLFGKEADLVPIKLQTKDVNGDGQADLIATAEDQQLIYINDNGNFRPINDQEKAKLTTLGDDK